MYDSSLDPDVVKLLEGMLDRNPKTRFDIDQVVNSPALKKRLAKFAQPLTNEEYTLLIKNFMVNSPTGLNSDTPTEVLKFACFDIQPVDWVNLQDVFQNTGYILNKGRNTDFKSLDYFAGAKAQDREGQYDKLREFERGQAKVASGQTWNDFVPPQMENEGLTLKKEGSFQKKPEQQSRTVIKIDNGENPWAHLHKQSSGSQPPAVQPPAVQPQKPLLNQLFEQRELGGNQQSQVQTKSQSQQQTTLHVASQSQSTHQQLQQQIKLNGQPVQEQPRTVTQQSQNREPQPTAAYQTAANSTTQTHHFQQPTFQQSPFSAHQTAKITKIQLSDNGQEKRHHFGLMSQRADASQDNSNSINNYPPQPSSGQEPQYGRQTPQFQKQTGPEIVGSISEFETKNVISNSKSEAIGQQKEQALPSTVRDNIYIKDWWNALGQATKSDEKAEVVESQKRFYSKPPSPASELVRTPPSQPVQSQEPYVDTTLVQSEQTGVKVVKRVYATNSFYNNTDPAPKLQSVNSAGVSPKANKQTNFRYEISAPTLKDLSLNHEMLDRDVSGPNSDLKAPNLTKVYSQNTTKQTRLKFEIDNNQAGGQTDSGQAHLSNGQGQQQRQVSNGQSVIKQGSQTVGFETNAPKQTDGSFTDRIVKNQPLVYKNGILTGRTSQYVPQANPDADRLAEQRHKSFNVSQAPVNALTHNSSMKLLETTIPDSSLEQQRQPVQSQAKPELTNKPSNKTFKINLSIHDQQRSVQNELKIASPGSPSTSFTSAFNTNDSNHLNQQSTKNTENSTPVPIEPAAIERSKNQQANVKKFKI